MSKPDNASSDNNLTQAYGVQPPQPQREEQVPLEWKVGDVILDLYEVQDIFTSGGMGLVYRVHHRGWNTDLAVKSPRPKYFNSPDNQENFVRECNTWINLGLHPHIVSCFYVRTLGGIPRIFAEFLPGGSLQDWIDDRRLYEGGGEKALIRILDISIQMAWGLQFAHEQGLVHQDVKPANVMLTIDGIAKVTDFGLAKARAAVGESFDPGRSILVSCGSMTPAFCSPEQADHQALSRRTDIWSWAVSLLEIFTGQVTWLAGQVADEALQAYLGAGEREDFLPPMPEELAALLRLCLQRESKDRPKDMLEIVSALGGIYEQFAGQPYPRQMPSAIELSAGALNNRAISLLDLGKQAEAEAAWQAALQVDPQHPESVYNQGLILWRSGQITNNSLVTRLKNVQVSHPNEWLPAYLSALVHLERDDCEAALEVLGQLGTEGAQRKEVAAARELAQKRLPVSRRCLRVFEGQTESVNSVCLSADGHYALSDSGFYSVKKDNTLRLWEIATGECLRVFKGHTSQVNSVCLSGDGCYALSGSSDKTLRLWEVASGKCLRVFEGHTSWVNSVCLSADGRYALSGSGSLHCNNDNTLRLWEVSTGKCLRVFEGHKDQVNSVCLSTDGHYALSGSGYYHGKKDNTLRLWEVSTGKCLRVFEGHTDEVTSVCLSADGRYALSGSWDNTLHLWEVSTGKCLRVFEGHTSWVNSVCLSVDGQYALSGSTDKTLRLWQVNYGGPYVPAPLSLSQVLSSQAVYSEQSSFEKTISQASQALAENKLAVAVTHLRAARTQPGHERHPQALELWDKLSAKLPRVALRAAWEASIFKGHTNLVTSVCLSADGRYALSGSGDKTIRLWEVASGKCLRVLEGHTGSVRFVCLSADGRYALSGSFDETLRLWDMASGKCLRVFKGHTYYVTSVCLSVDGRFALSGSGDLTLRLWEVASGKCLRVFRGHKYFVNSVCLSTDGQHALSGGDDTLRLWDTASGECLRVFEGHRDWVSPVCLSADGGYALSGSGSYNNRDDTLRLWEVSSGKCLRVFEGHTSVVLSVCLSSDGRYALSGSSDKTMRMWDVSSGKCLRVFEGHTDSVNSVCLSADGRYALSGSSDGTLRLWHLDWELGDKDPTDWDEGARPHLQNFLTLHTPYTSPDNLVRKGKPSWTEEDFQDLLTQLGYAGYGWLRPEGVRRELERMASQWQGPPTLY